MKIALGVPNDKQRQFFTAQSRFVGYGGSRGGGKSWAVRKKALLLCLYYAGLRVLVLRRTFPELRENHILPLMTDLKDVATYRETDKSFSFPNKSRLRFGYCDSEKDVLQYQGQEYDVIFIDEATQFTEYQYVTLTACLRGANNFPKRMYLTCNPGGVGHFWVKRLFIDRQYQNSEKPEDYTFIAASVYDNQALISADTGYVSMLENLPDGLRQAWLHGDWDVLEGRYFTEFDRAVHVIEPFPIPDEWDRYFTMDYGLDMLAGYWIAVDTAGRAVVYRELYAPNLIISQAAKRITGMTRETLRAAIAPPDLWNRRQDTGRSAAEIFAEHGLPVIKAQNSRVQGWYDLKEWLNPTTDEFGQRSAHLRIFSNCTNLIRCLPALVRDNHDPNDCANEPHEITHAPDALRYFCAGRPSPTSLPVERDPDERPVEQQINDLLDFGR